VQQDSAALMDLLAGREPLEEMAVQDPKDDKVPLEILVHLDELELLVLLDHRVSQDQLANGEK
jgi:hypothetical protein